MDIRLVKREDIIKEKWNGCVHYSPNGNVFGYTWFLDFIAKDWEALIEGDYLSVFPLVYRKRWSGNFELYQPQLMRAMGIYSVKALSAIRIKAFLDAIPNQYKKVDITLNERNRPPRDGSFQVTEQKNYTLPLNASYEDIAGKYSEDFQVKLASAEAQGLLPIGSVKPERIAELFKQQNKANADTEQQFHGLQRIMYNVLHRGTGFATAFADPKTQEVLAANFYIFSHGRMLSLAPVVTPIGKEIGALEMLTDYMVRSNAMRPIFLDFNTQIEDDLALAMGAEVERYYRIQAKKGWF